MLLITSPGIEKIRGLPELVGQPVMRFRRRKHADAVAVAGWGLKSSSREARALADQLALPYWSFEDGFLRSVSVGDNEPTLSLVIDDLGIYYDAQNPSRLELLIPLPLDHSEQQRARRLREAWRASRVSKYNHGRPCLTSLPNDYVLVVDQTFGDASVSHGLADADSFQRMLACALVENPDSLVLLKVHPEVESGKKRGYFNLDEVSKFPRVKVLSSDLHPAGLVEKAKAVYVVTSQMGFEALLWGKRVRTFGMPFYGGWGLTADELAAPERRRAMPLENLIHAALVSYPRYVDPETGKRCEVERVIDWMGLQCRMRARFAETLIARGFPLLKRATLRDFFQGSALQFTTKTGPVADGECEVVWGLEARSNSREILRVEDGFLRSVGLGAELVRPLSWVIDRSGIYYDATRPSDLEQIFLRHDFDDALLARAAALRERVVSLGLTKYNLGSNVWQRPEGHQRVILVPGQVESDASIAYGAPEGVCAVRKNMDLLRAVRAVNPDAWVVYKPHPDVLAGMRAKGLNEHQALQWCDEQVNNVSMNEMLAQVDEVHLITSLAGFEALLRGKKVTCYGQPFYAGWGLTTDLVPVFRRTRTLSLDALVAGALILYPTYVSRTTHRFTTPERALDELLAWREEEMRGGVWRRRLLRTALRSFKRWFGEG